MILWMEKHSAIAAAAALIHNIGVNIGTLCPVIFRSRRKLKQKLIKWVIRKLEKYPLIPYLGSNR